MTGARRAAWWLAAAAAVLVPMLVQHHWLRETYFVADDFSNFAFARSEGLTAKFLTSNYNPWEAQGIHVAPGHRVLDWLVTVPAGNRHGAAILAMVSATGATLAFTLGALDDLLGRRALHLLIVLVLGLAYPLLMAGSWFAAGAHALPGLCFTAGSLWGYARWRRTGTRWALAASWGSLALGLCFSPQPVLAVLYATLLAVLVVPGRLTAGSVLSALRADFKALGGLAVIAGAYVVHEALRSEAPTEGRTFALALDLLEAVARDAMPNIAGLALPDRLTVTVALAVAGAGLLTALGRRGLSALVFFLVVLVANTAVIWFGRFDVGVAAATEARYLTSLTLGSWIAVAIALSPAPHGPWRRLPSPRRRLAPAVAAAALLLVSGAAAKHYLGRLADGFNGATYTLQSSAAARSLAYRLDRDLDRLDGEGELRGLVNGEVPFPLFYDGHPNNQISGLGRAFNDHVAAEGRGPRLYMLTPAAEIKPATFGRDGAVVRRACSGSCELVLRPRAPGDGSSRFVRLRARSGARVTATASTTARAFIKPAPQIGAEPGGAPLFLWVLAPVALDPRSPAVTLQTWALDATELRVKLTGEGRFSVTAELGGVAVGG